MFDAERVVKSVEVDLDNAGCTHLSRIRKAMKLRTDSEVVAWALGIAAGRMPTMTELKAKKKRAAEVAAIIAPRGEVERFPSGLLEV